MYGPNESPSRLPRPIDPGPVDDLVELQTSIEAMRTSSLMVSVDWLDLVDREGETKAWETVGKLKDLLG